MRATRVEPAAGPVQAAIVNDAISSPAIQAQRRIGASIRVDPESASDQEVTPPAEPIDDPIPVAAGRLIALRSESRGGIEVGVRTAPAQGDVRDRDRPAWRHVISLVAQDQAPPRREQGA